MQATFTLNRRSYMCSDSPPIHDWDFTPAVSNYVECSDEAELMRLFTSLSEEGQVMMTRQLWLQSEIWMGSRSIWSVLAVESTLNQVIRIC